MALGRTAHAGHRPAVAGLVVALATAIGACAASPERAAVDDTPRATAERGIGTEPTAEAPTTTRPLPTTTTTSSTTTAPGPALPAGDDATVARIVDGDTLRAVVGGAEVAVRLIGIDTPEVRQDDCYADEATAHLTALVPPGAAIRLAYDVERHDRYGRTLAYVFRPGDGLHVNVAMARDGFAQQLTIPPNVAHADAVSAAVDEARAAGRGLWGGACAPAAPEATTPATPAPAPSGGAGCHPSYPSLCIPPAPPDLDCPDVGARRFPVVPPDPHGFDGDRDGIGCEG